MQLERNRYDPENLVAQLSALKPTQSENCWRLTVQAPIDEFEVYLDDINGSYSTEEYNLLLDLFRNVRHLDNLVQDFFNSEFAMSSYNLNDVMLHIGYIDMTNSPIRIRYWGTKVNVEWEAKVSRDAKGAWHLLNDFSQPDAGLYGSKTRRKVSVDVGDS